MLRAEFPEAFALASRIKRPVIAEEPPLWAWLAGAGAQWITSSLLIAVLSLLTLGFGLRYPFPPLDVIAALALLVGVAVAWRACGPLAAALYLAVAISFAVISYALATPERETFCERAGRGCPTLLDALASWLAFAVAAVAGIILSRGLTVHRGGANALLSAAGIANLVPEIARLVLSAIRPTGSAARDAMTVFGLIVVVTGALAGATAAARSKRALAALLLGAIYVVTWVPAGISLAANLPPFPITSIGYWLQQWTSFESLLAGFAAAMTGALAGIRGAVKDPRR
jgi:hypothetical protein